MTAVIDVGGGFRDIYGSGVFDTCLEENISFDCCIAVSAGSANIASYLAKQSGRNYRFYTDYAFRKEYMSARNLFDGKHYLDLNYVYGELSLEGGEDPLDYDVFNAYGGILNIVATDALTGRPHYFEKSDIKQNDFSVFKASSSIPIVCGKTEVNGRLYYDGGVSDPVPVKRALSLGCDKIVLILTRPSDYIVDPKRDLAIASMMEKEYAKSANALRVHALRYNRAVRQAKKLEEEGRCLIISPDEDCGVSTLTRDKESLDALYRKGREDGLKIKNFLCSGTAAHPNKERAD